MISLAYSPCKSCLNGIAEFDPLEFGSVKGFLSFVRQFSFLENGLQVVEVLNPLAREYKSIGTMKKELAGLQEDLSQAHRQVLKLLVNEKMNSDLIIVIVFIKLYLSGYIPSMTYKSLDCISFHISIETYPSF